MTKEGCVDKGGHGFKFFTLVVKEIQDTFRENIFGLKGNVNTSFHQSAKEEEMEQTRTAIYIEFFLYLWLSLMSIQLQSIFIFIEKK